MNYISGTMVKELREKKKTDAKRLGGEITNQ